MTLNHHQRVIGVFGSASRDKTERAAVALLAAAIHRAGAVLLTGAEPPDGGYPDDFEPTDVKDVAVHALRKLTSEQEVLWIGVGRHDDALPPKCYGNEGIVVIPGWDNRRNFVEAAICDAAFAVDATTAGTASEALFCLYLGRPVTVVSRTPDAVLSAATLKDTNGTRVQPRGDERSVDVGIQRALEWADSTDTQVATVPLPTDADGADALAQKLMESLPGSRGRGPFENLTDEDDWDHYLRRELSAAGRW